MESFYEKKNNVSYKTYTDYYFNYKIKSDEKLYFRSLEKRCDLI